MHVLTIPALAVGAFASVAIWWELHRNRQTVAEALSDRPRAGVARAKVLEAAVSALALGVIIAALLLVLG